MMKRNKWKIIAVVFICLFVLQTALTIWAWCLGTNIINEDNECSTICFNKEADAYFYDEYDRICFCEKDHEIIYQQSMR